MTPRTTGPDSRVAALWRRVALQLGVAAAAGAVVAAAALLLVSWLAVDSVAWARPSVLPLVIWFAVAIPLGAWAWRLARQARGWSRSAAAHEIEAGVGLRRGSLLGAVEGGAERPGTSRALVERQRELVGRRLEGLPVARLGEARAASARRAARVSTLLAAALVIGTAAVLIAARDSATRAWADALHPVRQLSTPPLPPLRIIAGADRVRRGRDLPVTVEAPQRDSVRLAWQPRGRIASQRWIALSAGRARAVVPRLDAPTLVWAVAADGASSDTLRVTPFDPLLLVDVRVDLRFPPHTRREREVLSAPLPLISVPAGTWATVTGTATLPVERALLASPAGGRIPFEVTDGRRFRSGFTVRTGSWGWQIVGSGGRPLEGEPDSLYFQAVPDSMPTVDVIYPGIDTTLSITMTQPLVIDARDDYGLTRVEVVSWRVSAWGERWPEQVEPLAVDSGASRASLPALLDARGRGFLPGDTLHYFARAFDNAPQPQEARSREYILRLPTLDEVRDRAITEAHDLVEDSEALAERARQQQEALEALDRAARSQPAPGERPQQRTAPVEFRETEAARQAQQEAGQLLQQAEEIQQTLRELQEAVEAAGLNDTTVLERLREIESLYERILTPQLREQIEALRDALSELDEQQIRQAIQQLAEGSAEFRERIEQTVELLKRAALEQEFATLETQADELAEQHEQLAERVTEGDSATAGLDRQALELSEQAQQLSERIEALARELAEASEQDAAEQATEARSAAGEASESDRQTAGALPRQLGQASESAQRAAAQMRQAASSLQEGREGMQQSWRREVAEALQRTQTEALELARRQGRLAEQMRGADSERQAQARSEQGALKRGVDQMESEMSQEAARSLLMDRQLLDQVNRISAAMEELLSQMSDGSRDSRGDPRQAAKIAESLNDLAFQAMRAADEAGSAQSGTGLQEALQQLAQLAEQQGELNAQAGGLQPGDALDAILQQLQQLGARQRAIGEQLQQMNRELGPRGQVLGRVDELGREAEELARQLESGRLNEEIITRQERLYNRLLDAGHTLERDEYERERRAERPGEVEVLRPGELDPELLEGPRYPMPDAATLSRYSPAIRRLIIEYFDRLNRGGSPDGS